MAKSGESSDLATCSFCGKPQDQVDKLIAGPGVYICNECIELCTDIILEEGIGSAPAERPAPTPEDGVGDLLTRVTEARGRLEGQLGRRPTLVELSVELGLDERELGEVLRRAVAPGAGASRGEAPGAVSPVGFLCRPCMLAGTVRQAWTVTAGDATCVRHAVESTELDDMDQHDLFVVIYEDLRRIGFPNAY